jgi:Domain of unknown function (DUF4145)
MDHPSGDMYMYSFCSCPRCEGPFVAMQQLEFDGERSEPTRLYPAHSDGISSSLPAPIRAAFQEATVCFRAQAYTATAIMCRKTLEGICHAHSVTERNLAKSLEKLRDNGVIDARLFDWADALRLFGNDAAHDVNVTIGASDARDILDFTRALVEYVFTFHERFLAFQARRQAGAAS